MLKLKEKYDLLRQEKNELKKKIFQQDNLIKKQSKELYLVDKKTEKLFRKKDWTTLQIQFEFDKCIETITKIQQHQYLEISEAHKKIESKLNKIRKELSKLRLENPELKKQFESNSESNVND